MNLKNKFILKFSIGFSIGMFICTIITSILTTNIMNDGNTYFCSRELVNVFGNELLAFIIQLTVSGLYGAICLGSTIAYEIEDWSILKATSIHFLITVSSFYITAFILRWWGPYVFNIIFLISFVLAYAFIWLIQYITYKIEVKKIQENIDKLHKK